MRILIDTNALLRYAVVDDALHRFVRPAVEQLQAAGHELGFCPQVARELWNSLTRPKTKNGFGLTPTESEQILNALEAIFEVWNDVPGIYMNWKSIVAEAQVSGVQVHDANIAAAALVHGATHILTLNDRDFDRYARFGLTPVHP